MKKKNLIILLFALLYTMALPNLSRAQSKAPVGFLKIGDKVPDIVFPIKNYKSSTAKISDFRGKLVILDLWAVYCSACIAGMPHMQELQKKFDGKLQVIMVTKNNDGEIAKLAKRSDNVKNNTLPSVTDAAGLAGMFDYTFIPTHIWIDQNGIIKHIANGGAANENNIAAFLAGKELQIEEKVDLKINRHEPLLVQWYPYQKQLSMTTYLAPANLKYTTAGGIGQIRNERGYLERVGVDCGPLSDLYRLAYGLGAGSNNFSESRVLLNMRDSLKYKFDPTVAYTESKANLFVYELLNQNDIADNDIYDFMRRQLDLIFNLKSKWEKRNVPVFILRRIEGVDVPKSDGNQAKSGSSRSFLSIENVKWRNFIRSLNNIATTPLQLLDETGIDPETKVKVSIKTTWNDLGIVNLSLKPFGLVVTKEMRSLDCIILSDVVK